jgi:RNA polymerase sigma factor (sigma-70 family)
MELPGDDELIRESLATPSAFGAIFDRHSRSVFRYVRRRIGDELAVDVTAEVFTRAFRDRERFDGRDESVLPWLLGIGTNLIRMHHRAEERRLRAYARAAGQDCGEPANDEIDDRLAAEGARGALTDALAELSTRQRDILLLHAWGELSPSEIAVALALPPGTVRSDLHRARSSVAARLAAHAPHIVPDQEPTR